VYLALAPKSNASYRALAAARDWVREHGTPEIPAPLRSAAYPGARSLGRGEGYDCPHDRPGALSGQELMPAATAGTRFLELTDHGEEARLRERLEEIRGLRAGRRASDEEPAQGFSGEHSGRPEDG
jgi:putative ATPase